MSGECSRVSAKLTTNGIAVTLFRRAISVAAIAGLAVGTLAFTAPPANAETLHTHRAKTAKIRPAKIAPANARITRSVITVKQGSKTVAKDKRSYKAKRGTYKVTTKVTFQRQLTVTLAATSVWTACRIDSMAIASDRTTWSSWGDGTGYYAGQVTFAYAGTCTDTFYDQSFGAHYVEWHTAWQTDDYVMTENVTAAQNRAVAIIAAAHYGLGDVDYVDGTAMTTLPTYRTWASAQTIKRTRTVKVKR